MSFDTTYKEFLDFYKQTGKISTDLDDLWLQYGEENDYHAWDSPQVKYFADFETCYARGLYQVEEIPEKYMKGMILACFQSVPTDGCLIISTRTCESNHKKIMSVLRQYKGKKTFTTKRSATNTVKMIIVPHPNGPQG